jgi:NADPH-dependent curcumin reductase
MTDQVQRIVLAARPQGAPKTTDFRTESLPMPALGDGEFSVRVVWLSLDPYMRGRMDDAKSYVPCLDIGAVMEGGAVGQIVDSRHPKFASGDWVTGPFGWQTQAISNGKMVRKLDPTRAPVSTSLGVLGMPGFTAYVGLNLFGRPSSCETIVVSAASGAVGSLVGQLAKLQGLRVVGVAGGAEKCDYVVDELGFDACVDHKACGDVATLRNKLAEQCSDGVDIYYENVAGITLQAIIPLMNTQGRIPVCGMISWYNEGGLGANLVEGKNLLPQLWRSILVKRLSVNGFIITDHSDQFVEFYREVSGRVQSGEISYRESISEGLPSAPEAFISLLKGGNFGKQLVRISSPSNAQNIA